MCSQQTLGQSAAILNQPSVRLRSRTALPATRGELHGRGKGPGRRKAAVSEMNLPEKTE